MQVSCGIVCSCRAHRHGKPRCEAWMTDSRGRYRSKNEGTGDSAGSLSGLRHYPEAGIAGRADLPVISSENPALEPAREDPPAHVGANREVKTALRDAWRLTYALRGGGF